MFYCMSLLSGSATKVTHPDGSLLLWHQASCWGVVLLASPGLPWAVFSSSFVGCLRVVLGLFSGSSLAQLGYTRLKRLVSDITSLGQLQRPPYLKTKHNPKKTGGLYEVPQTKGWVTCRELVQILHFATRGRRGKTQKR